MDDIERIYSLLLHSKGLKIREISKDLKLDKYYVAEILFSPHNIPYWYQDDDSLWFVKEGSLQIEEPKGNEDELINPIEKPQKYNINKFLQDNVSDSLKAYLYKISQFRVYSNIEIIELLKQYRDGDKRAYDLIVKSQQRLVANIAYLYRGKGAPLEDIIQEGNIGLIKAIERFDYTQFHSFYNYAKNWILQAISFSMTTMPFMVRLPLNQLAIHRKICKFKEKFVQVNEYPPSLNDIETGVDVDWERIELLSQFPDNLKSLVEFNENMDFIESDFNLVAIYEDQEDNKQKVHNLFNRLKNREEYILRFYFGIDTLEETLLSIGEKMNLTRERVRQIIWKSLRRLQDTSHIQREEAKVGDIIRIDSSQQTGRVINTKLTIDGSIILVVKMDSGGITEVSVNDTPYHIVKHIIKKNHHSHLVTERGFQIHKDRENSKIENEKKEIVNNYREVKELGNFKVGDNLYFENHFCTVKKLFDNGKSSKIIIEYKNGVTDVIPYSQFKYLTVSDFRNSVPSIPQNDTIERKRFHKNAEVGDRILYNSRTCIVLDKKIKYNTIRLTVKYEDGTIDNISGDKKRYIII